MVIFFIELSSGNKKNIIIKLFEPSERRKYVFLWPEKCGYRSWHDIRMCICPSSKIYAEPVFVLEFHFLKKDRGTKNEYFSYSKEVHNISGRTTKQH